MEAIGPMLQQSLAILRRPTVATFERYERRGSFFEAALYIGFSALVAGVLGLVGGIAGMLTGIVGALVNFFVFTGLVYLIGCLRGGSGTFSEVAYTFSLFIAPLIVIWSALGFVARSLQLIPVVGGVLAIMMLYGLLIGQIFFAYLALQASMNILHRGTSLLILCAAAIGTLMMMLLVLQLL